MTADDSSPASPSNSLTPLLTTRLLEQAREGNLITDAEQRIVAATRLTGYTQADLLGATPAILRSEVHSDAFFAHVYERLEATDGWEGEIWNRRKDG